MNVKKLFEDIDVFPTLDEKNSKLLEILRNMTKPLDCTDEVATDLDLKTLEEALDKIDRIKNESSKFFNVFSKLKAIKTTSQDDFI